MKMPKLLSGLGNSLRTKDFRVGGYSAAAAAIVIAIAVAVNILAGSLPAGLTQFDITPNQLFALSAQTETVLKNLDQEITVYWIVQDGMEDATVQTLLSRYADLSGKLRVVKKDPDVYPTFVQQYVSDGVYNNSLIVQSEARFRYISYTELYEYNYDNYYYTGSYDMAFAGESALTSAINYCVSGTLQRLYVLSGHGEAALSTAFSTAVERENVETASLSLVSSQAVPEDADCVLMNIPQRDLSLEEAELLRAYLQGGGKLLLITDPLQEGRLTNLEAVLAEYGVTAAEGVVVEGNANYYAWGTPYCLLPTVEYHTITAPLQQGGYAVLLPIAQGLTVSDALPEGVSVTELLTTSSSAFSKQAGYALSTYEREDGDIDGPFALAVSIEAETTGAGIVWVSSGGLVDDDTNTQISGGNQDLFLNALSYLCGADENAISIRAKTLSAEYLTMDSATASWLTVAVVGVIPLAYLAVGCILFIRRKRR